MIRIEVFVQIFLYLGVFLQLTEAYHRLELIQVLFRHGDRTPSEKELYPELANNPIYEALGFGQLTEAGKMREQRLGSLLRERYIDFLGDVHQYGDAYAVSTDFKRTKMSLQIVLDGLYPPALNTSNQRPWFPVPTVYLPKVVDMLLMTVYCPKYIEEVRQIKNSDIIRQQIAKYNDLFEYLSESTGLNVTSNPILQTARLFQVLTSQKSLNITLPDWATELVQKCIEEIVMLYYDIASYTMQLKRLNGGAIIKEFIKNMNLTGSPRTPKIYLYSGHETNIAGFTKAHGLIEPKIPDYGSAIIVEKWRNNVGKNFIKMFLWTGVTEELIALKLPGCGMMCSYDRYLRLVQDVIPSDEESDCLWNNITKDELREYYNTHQG